MRAINLFLYLLLITFATHPIQSLGQCSVANFPFDSNALDISGYNNHGTVFGCTLTNDRLGNSNSAYNFDGINDFIEIPISSSLLPNTPEVTLAAWFQMQGGSGYRAICVQRSPQSSSATDIYGLWINATDELYFELAGSKTKIFSTFNAGSIDNQWHHVALVKNSSVPYVKMYLDGQYIDSGNIDVGNIAIANQVTRIGMHQVGSAQYFNGKIDELGIYNCALNSCEIAILAEIILILNTSSISGDTAVINGQQSNYSVSNTVGNTYSWLVPKGTIVSGGNTNSITVNWDSPGTSQIQVVETDSLGCYHDSSILNITIACVVFQTGIILGQNQVSPFQTETYSVSQKIGSTFDWTIAGGNIISGTGTNSVGVQWGAWSGSTLNVVETDSNGCMSDSSSLAIVILNGIDDLNVDYAQYVYPNPFTNQATLSLASKNNELHEFKFYDITGRLIHSFRSRSENVELDAKDFPIGFIIYEVLENRTKIGGGKFVRY
ncbi:MAG: LamG domain-containing protein [Bacteroidetes bacterium]|nr:LamG domain-containing protein [Bacteroidota bacterium]